MIELSSDPTVARKQVAYHDAIRKARQGLDNLYKGQFRSDPEGIARDTLAALKEQVEVWENLIKEHSL